MHLHAHIPASGYTYMPIHNGLVKFATSMWSQRHLGPWRASAKVDRQWQSSLKRKDKAEVLGPEVRTLPAVGTPWPVPPFSSALGLTYDSSNPEITISPTPHSLPPKWSYLQFSSTNVHLLNLICKDSRASVWRKGKILSRLILPRVSLPLIYED